jgi:hypothetical protein
MLIAQLYITKAQLNMKKKSLILLILTCLTATSIFAQNFMHSAGVTISVLTGKVNTPSEKYTAAVSFANFTYFPKFTLTESESSSFTIGVPLGAGIGVSNSTGGGDAGLYYGFDFPLVADYNRGRKSTNDNEDSFGWFVGTGFSYTLTYFTDGSSTDKLNSYGPLLRAGIRFGAGSNHPDRATTVGFSFKPGLESTKFKTFAAHVLYDF